MNQPTKHSTDTKSITLIFLQTKWYTIPPQTFCQLKSRINCKCINCII